MKTQASPEPRHIEHIQRLAARQQLSGAGAAGIPKLEAHRRAAPGDTGYLQRTVHGRAAVVETKDRVDQLAGIRIVDHHMRFVTARCDHGLVHRERAHGGRHVSAVAVVVDGGITYRYLRKREIDVGLGMRGRPDHADLRQRGDAAAHAIELTCVRVRATHSGEKDRIPLCAIGR
jgi:hypothetical protein